MLPSEKIAQMLYEKLKVNTLNIKSISKYFNISNSSKKIKKTSI